MQVWKSTVNLDKLWALVPEEVREKYLNKQNDTAPVIDTLALVIVAPCLTDDRAIPKFSERVVCRILQ